MAALAQVRTARAMDAYSLQQLQPQIFCRNSVRRASRFQRIGSCSRQKRLQPQAANQGIARSNGIAFEHRNAVSPSDATVAVPSADNFSRHSQPADIDSDGCPRTLDSQIANQRRQSPGVSFDGSQLLEPRPESYSDFVNHFRNASPYIEGHRGGTFVLVIPSEVLERRDVLEPVLEDLALLHVLGVRLVVVLGSRQGIDNTIRAAGGQVRYVDGLRVTDVATMQAAIQAAGAARMEFEASLSKGLNIPMVRRHKKGLDNKEHHGPQVQTVSGNYVAGKRKGVVDGVDLGFTGVVRYVETAAINRQLAAGYLVLLSNLGYSPAGEVLNCDVWAVATRTAVDLQADKIICLTLPEYQVDLNLGSWAPLTEAQSRLNALASDRDNSAVQNGNLPGDAANSCSGDELDFDKWLSLDLPMALCTACACCGAGVRRAHIVDASVDGCLLMELYSAEGAANTTMISNDFYQGMRSAVMGDLEGIATMLLPLEKKGILKPRSPDQLQQELPHYVVIEREEELLGCALLAPLGCAPDGAVTAEIAAFCVSPAHRGAGRGDALLEYLENKSQLLGIQRLVLLTTRTADWFQQRGFEPAGVAHDSLLLPDSRRLKVDASRNSQLFAKRCS